MREFNIGAKKIGKGHPVLIIAEAGVNHNGKFNLAIKLIKSAKLAGADIVKFQTFTGPDVVIDKTEMVDYQRKILKVKKSQRKMLEELSLPYQWYPKLLQAAQKNKIMLIFTPHGGFTSVDFLERFSQPAYKIGSGDLTNIPFLDYIAKKKRPLILSTGMGNFAEIDEAIKTITATGNRKLAILHCTTAYPCPYKEVNLNTVTKMINSYPYPVGYSDHTQGIKVAVYAALIGAMVIEKHITLDRKLPGPDQKNSLEPREFREMVIAIREAESLTSDDKQKRIAKIPQVILGSRIKRPTTLELRNARLVRKSLVWTRNLDRGMNITKKDVEIKRPGTGIHPREYWTIIGKETKVRVKKNTLINKSQIA